MFVAQQVPIEVISYSFGEFANDTKEFEESLMCVFIKKGDKLDSFQRLVFQAAIE